MERANHGFRRGGPEVSLRCSFCVPLIRALADARLATEESCLRCLSLPELRWRAERMRGQLEPSFTTSARNMRGRTSTALPYVRALDEALKEAV
jgi:hypothetical protein